MITAPERPSLPHMNHSLSPNHPRAARRFSSQLDIPSILRQVPLLASLDTAQLHSLGDHGRLLQVERGTLVTVEGHPIDALYIVACGRFRRFRTSPRGREQILALLASGDTFGEIPLLDGSEDFASTQAMQRGTLFVLPSAHFAALLSAGAIPLSGIHRILTDRIRHMAQIIDDLSFCHVVERIARLILEQSHPPSRPHLTQATMAAMIGTTREVVARTIHELNDSGAISVQHGRISIRDVVLLRDIAAGDRC